MIIIIIKIIIAIMEFVVLAGAAAGVLIALYKGVRALDEMKKNGEERRQENVLIIHGVLASLRGLEQLGANGEVTQARTKLESFVIEH